MVDISNLIKTVSQSKEALETLNGIKNMVQGQESQENNKESRDDPENPLKMVINFIGSLLGKDEEKNPAVNTPPESLEERLLKMLEKYGQRQGQGEPPTKAEVQSNLDQWRSTAHGWIDKFCPNSIKDFAHKVADKAMDIAQKVAEEKGFVEPKKDTNKNIDTKMPDAPKVGREDIKTFKENANKLSRDDQKQPQQIKNEKAPETKQANSTSKETAGNKSQGDNAPTNTKKTATPENTANKLNAGEKQHNSNSKKEVTGNKSQSGNAPQTKERAATHNKAANSLKTEASKSNKKEFGQSLQSSEPKSAAYAKAAEIGASAKSVSTKQMVTSTPTPQQASAAPTRGK